MLRKPTKKDLKAFENYKERSKGAITFAEANKMIKREDRIVMTTIKHIGAILETRINDVDEEELRVALIKLLQRIEKSRGKKC